MQIEAGKYYRTRDGRKVGPMHVWLDGVDHKWQAGYGECTCIYTPNGDIWNDAGVHCEQIDAADLIAEWVCTPSDDPDIAALAAQHRIKITVQVGEVIVEYDGRE